MKSLTLSLSASLLVLNACQMQPNPGLQAPEPIAESLALANPTSALPSGPYALLIEKTEASGQVSIAGNQLQLSLNLFPKAAPGFQTHLLDLTDTTNLRVTVRDSHGKTYTAVGDSGSGVSYTGGTINLTVNNVTPNPLILVEVEARIGSTVIPQTQIATAFKYDGINPPPATSINFQTTVAAKTLATILDAVPGNPANPTRARAISISDLNTLSQSITGRAGSGTGTTYADNHPSLVNTTLLASDLVNQPTPNPLSLVSTAASYRQGGATLPISVNGLTGGDQIKVQITDAASAIKDNLGTGNSSITGATPGNGLTVKVSPTGTQSQTYSYAFPATVDLDSGANPTLTITATPSLNVASATPLRGAPSTPVTLNGSGFTDVTSVKFNGTNGTNLTVSSDTQLTVQVPAGASNGLITVSKGATTVNGPSFNVTRISSVSPTVGAPGTPITINGDGFTGTLASSVKINGTTASSVSVSNTQITANIPVGATSGAVSLTNGAALSGPTFTVTRITSLSTTSGPPGTVVNINGTGFTGTNPASVKFNGVTATNVSVSASQIQATVPAGASNGPVSLTNGAALTGPSFTVTNLDHVIFVKANATGNNDGSSWSNAYTNLQTALAAAVANKEIWMAAGKYTPDASNQSASFQMKTDVDIYGGFAGTETARNQRIDGSNIAYLSGDIDNNDTGTGAAYSRAGSNSYTIVRGANAILDGVTIQGAHNPNGDGGGMVVSGVSPTLNKVTFLNNSAISGGGIGIFASAAPTLNNVEFLYNRATAGLGGGGAGIYNEATVTINKAFFQNNVARYNGGAFNNQENTNATAKDLIFINNSVIEGSGQDMYSFANTNVILSNVATWSSVSGTSIYSLGHLELTNVTTNRNIQCISTVTDCIPINVLMFNSGISTGTHGVNGNQFITGTVGTATDPFIDADNPLGADGIPFTSDDGYNLKAGAVVINQGIFGGNVPAKDILNQNRNGNPEPGAYEY